MKKIVNNTPNSLGCRGGGGQCLNRHYAISKNFLNEGIFKKNPLNGGIFKKNLNIAFLPLVQIHTLNGGIFKNDLNRETFKKNSLNENIFDENFHIVGGYYGKKYF